MHDLLIDLYLAGAAAGARVAVGDPWPHEDVPAAALIALDGVPDADGIDQRIRALVRREAAADGRAASIGDVVGLASSARQAFVRGYTDALPSFRCEVDKTGARVAEILVPSSWAPPPAPPAVGLPDPYLRNGESVASYLLAVAREAREAPYEWFAFDDDPGGALGSNLASPHHVWADFVTEVRDGVDRSSKCIDAPALRDVFDRLLRPVKGLPDERRAALLGSFLTLEIGDIDRDVADVLIQVAMFDEVRYG